MTSETNPQAQTNIIKNQNKIIISPVYSGNIRKKLTEMNVPLANYSNLFLGTQ